MVDHIYCIWFNQPFFVKKLRKKFLVFVYMSFSFLNLKFKILLIIKQRTYFGFTILLPWNRISPTYKPIVIFIYIQVRDAMLKTDDRPSCLTNGSFNPKQCRFLFQFDKFVYGSFGFADEAQSVPLLHHFWSLWRHINGGDERRSGKETP